jgi:ubiquinone/menaquinone biosynthesis C-methylase UbiE
MYKRIRGNFEESIKGKVLGISGINNFYPLIDMKNSKIIEAEFPIVDMQNLPYENNAFDFVVSDQVVEHLEEPQKAINESCRVLKKGGIAIHTTCFMNYIHPDPIDLWRFSPEGLRYLCREFSEIICCEGWGNRIAIFLCFLSRKFRYMEIPETKCSIRNFVATYNEERVPIVTWVIAKK